MLWLWILALILLILSLLIWRQAPWQPQHIWPQIYGLPLKTKDPLIVWKKLASWPWYSQPGFVVKQLSLDGNENLLKRLRILLSLEEFYGLKQWLWTTNSIVFLAWLWFGELTLKGGLTLGFIAFISVFFPDLWLRARRATQQRKIAQQVPYFLDLLTLTLQAGGNLEQGLKATTQNYHSDLSLAIEHKLRELEWGRPLDELFTELGAEIEDEDWQHFLSSLLRAKKLGVSLGDTLAVQAELMRTRRRQKAEELSRTAAVKISVPLVLFIFPALLIIYIGPGILQLLERT